MTELKKQSIAAYELWHTSGRPVTGPIHVAKNNANVAYKIAIKKVKDLAATKITDELHESLLIKISVSFRKTSKTKVFKQPGNKIKFKNNYSDTEAAEKFAVSLKAHVLQTRHSLM